MAIALTHRVFRLHPLNTTTFPITLCQAIIKYVGIIIGRYRLQIGMHGQIQHGYEILRTYRHNFHFCLFVILPSFLLTWRERCSTGSNL